MIISASSIIKEALQNWVAGLTIGLMGVDNDGTLYSPNGKRIFKIPPRAANRIQIIQHSIAKHTWYDKNQ